MSLFQRFLNGSRLTFNCVGLSDDEQKDITKVVEENGGKIGESILPIIFMQKSKYKEELHIPLYRVYDINFIKTCVRKGKIVDFRPFRLGPKKLGETAILSSFVHGVSCFKCAMEKFTGSPIIADSASSSETEDGHAVSVTRTISSPGNLANDNSEVDESQSVVSNPYSRSMRRVSSDSKVHASRSIVQKPVKLSHSSDKRRKSHLMPLPLSSQETDSFYTPRDELVIKSEPIETQSWEHEPKSPKIQMPVTSETQRVDVSVPLSGSEIPSNPNTHLQSPDNSPNAVRKESVCGVPLSSSSPRIKVLNVSRLMPRPFSAKALQSNPIAFTSSNAAKAMPLNSSQKIRKSHIAKAGHQTSTNTSEVTGKKLQLSSRIAPLKVNLQKKMVSPRTSRVAENVDTNTYPISSRTAETSLSVSPTSADGPEQESPWIPPDDTWMHNQKINNRVHPTTEYVQCDEGRVPLLRLNVTSGNNVEAIEDSTTCSDEDMVPLTASIKPRKKNTKLHNVREEQKSPDTSKKSKETMITASKKRLVEANTSRNLIISDSDDEIDKTPTNGTNETLGKKTSRIIYKNPPSRRREKSPSDIEEPGTSGLNRRKRTVSMLCLSDSDEADVSKTIHRTKSKDRDNGNGGARKEQQSFVTLKTANKRNKREKMTEALYHVRSSYSSRSDSDAEQEAPAKRRVNGDVEVERRKKKLYHPAFDMDSETEDPLAVEKLDKSDEDVHSEHDGSTSEVASNVDEAENTSRRKKARYTRQDPNVVKNKALKYAKDWRVKLEASRTVKVEVTRMKFTRSEQQTMVNFLCSHPDIERLQPKGLKVWNALLKKGLLPCRTAQSLQNHFVKSLLPSIQTFFRGMSEEHKAQFRAIQTTSSRKYL